MVIARYLIAAMAAVFDAGQEGKAMMNTMMNPEDLVNPDLRSAPPPSDFMPRQFARRPVSCNFSTHLYAHRKLVTIPDIAHA